MVTTRSRSNSTVVHPTSSPNATKNLGRPAKTCTPNLDMEANDLLTPKDDAELDLSVKIQSNAANFDQIDHKIDKVTRKKDRSQLKLQNRVQKQLLRRKVTGMGVTVTVQESSGICETKPTNRKVVFDDNDSKESHDDLLGDDPIDEQTKDTAGIQGENGDDDDYLVEEVMGSIQAKDQLRFEAEQIRVAQRAAVKKQKKTRRALKNQVTTESKGTGFDLDFFQQLEEEHIQTKKRKKLKSRDMDDTTKQRPKHTTFVMHENGMIEDHVVEHPHNIEVVVLSHNEQPSNEPESDMYSRCGFIDPNLAPNTAISEKTSKTKRNAKNMAKVVTWTRSDKMKHILSVPSRVRQKGKPAIQFVNKSTR